MKRLSLFLKESIRLWRYQITTIMLLITIAGAMLPIPCFSPLSKNGKDRSRPFPCQDRPCGCRSFEQCKKQCCCYSAEQKRVWANRNQARVTQVVLAALMCETDVIAIRKGMLFSRAGQVRQFVASCGENATYVTSVCTGSLILGAAGLLQGYRATTHWLALNALRSFGAEPVAERVVSDRNRVTGAGVTAGIDFALTLAARLKDESYAKAIQLMMEYDPQPPFQSGNPHVADPETVKVLEAMAIPFHKQLESISGRQGN